jgi:hypothetical protein
MGAVKPGAVSLLVLWLSLQLVGCGLGAASPTSEICDGMAAEMGGCDEDLPTFTADDCDGVAREWGRLVDSQVLNIISGPEAVEGEARSVRTRQATVLLSTLAGRHLDEVGVRAQCDATRFVEVGEGEFSDDLRQQVGSAMFDGQPVVPYEEWLADLARTATSIEDD